MRRPSGLILAAAIVGRRVPGGVREQRRSRGRGQQPVANEEHPCAGEHKRSGGDSHHASPYGPAFGHE